jgi:pyridoxine kinase
LYSKPKRIAAVHDLSGFGRCSLTAAIPILSAMGLHCCPMPTAVLSSQTGFSDFSYLDFTPYLPDFIGGWRRLGLSFDAVYSGFLGSVGQIDIVSDFIKEFRTQDTLIAVDPVMGDNGRQYPGFSDEMCSRMTDLVRCADMVFPNLTEALMLTGRAPSAAAECSAQTLAREISSLGPSKVIITGGVEKDKVTNYVYDSATGSFSGISGPYSGTSYSGTGDIFASVVTGSLTLGRGLEDSVRTAAAFIAKAVALADSLGSDPREGVIFEPYLKELG